MKKVLNLSYWEIRDYFKVYDLIVIGSGIVGLSSAISYREKNPKASILVLEKGLLPEGASTKNAGFACFGSAGELISDLQNMTPEAVWETVTMRWQGLQLLRKRLGDKNIRYKDLGNFELFRSKKKFAEVMLHLPALNHAIKRELGLKNCYNEVDVASFPFRGIQGIIRNRYEGQLDTGAMMLELLKLARSLNIDILNCIPVSRIQNSLTHVNIHSSIGDFKSRMVIVAVNGFAQQLLNIKDVHPARAQVLVTSKIPGLKIKGAFHFEEGYYYFRNINGRVLLRGGRHLDPEKEKTTSQALSPKIQDNLDDLLHNIILHDTEFTIDHRWTGTMGLGKEKKPIITKINNRTVVAVRLGGMGIAIGSTVGQKAAEMAKYS